MRHLPVSLLMIGGGEKIDWRLQLGYIVISDIHEANLYSFFELILNSTIPWFEFPVSSLPPVFLRVASSSSSEKFDASEGVFESSSDPDAAEPSEDGDNESDISSAYTRCAYRSIWYILYQNISRQKYHWLIVSSSHKIFTLMIAASAMSVNLCLLAAWWRSTNKS